MLLNFVQVCIQDIEKFGVYLQGGAGLFFLACRFISFGSYTIY